MNYLFDKGYVMGIKDHDYILKSTSDKSVILKTNPHYSDERFKKPQTVFCTTPDKIKLEHNIPYIKGLSYVYSDRLIQWDWKAHDNAWEYASEKYPKKTANFYEKYLSIYFKKEIELIHIVSGVNRSNGYSYQIFGYKEN